MKAIALKPDYLLGYRNLSIIYANLSRYDEALQVAQTGLQCCGEDAWLHYDMAVALCATGRVNEGIQNIQKSLAMCPTHFLSHMSLGDIYVNLSRYDAAMEQYLLAQKISADPRVAQRIAELKTKSKTLAGVR